MTLQNTTVSPPVARKNPKTLHLHGDTRVDDYYWMRDKAAPETIQYLEDENCYTTAVMKSTETLQEQLYGEILGRIKQTDLSVPARRGEYFYYSRTEEGKQYPIWCRKRGSLDAPEQVMLDGNELAAGHDYFAIGGLTVSESANLLAYSADFNGSEQFTLRVKDLTTGELLPDSIPGTTYGIEWGNDNRTLFYVTFDATQRPEKVHRHLLGTEVSSDITVFTEADPLFSFGLGKTRSRKYLLIASANASTTSEVHYLPADHPEQDFQLMEPRREGVEYYADHQGDFFLIRTNEDGAINFKLMTAPLSQPSRKNWKLLRAEQPEATLDEVDAFERFLVLHTREDGLPQIRVRRVSEEAERLIPFPEPAYALGGAQNPEYDSDLLRFTYTSLITPASVYDYNMDTGERTLLKQTEVLGGYDPAQYRSERLHAMAPDGKRVPISLVYKAGLVKNGQNPLLLEGYGSYGINSDPAFHSTYLSLLDRGFVVAIAHIRGGAEYGRAWFEDGRMLRKRNSFTDFAACAEYLIAEKYTGPSKLTAIGGSAGGLLMGAVVNLRPDLFHAVVAQVPFVDVVTTMLDPTIPLTTGEYDQWGNPENKIHYEYMRSYSPYDNVERKDYPHMLVTTGLNDPRVAYWEPAKWVAKLRVMKTDDHLLLLKTQMGAGHGGPSGRYERYREQAFIYAFLLKTLGMTD